MVLVSLLFCAILAIVLQRCTYVGVLEFGLPDLAACYVGCMCFATIDLFSNKYLVAVLVTCLLLFVLTITSLAKQKALRNEPLLFSDVTLLVQVFRFPWLYLPFLPYKIVLWAVVLLLVALYCTWHLEADFAPWLTVFIIPPLFCFLALKINLLAKVITTFLKARHLQFSVRDVQTYGPFGAAILHSLWHVFVCHKLKEGIPYSTSLPSEKLSWPQDALVDLAEFKNVNLSAKLPHILLIQEESFCDPRVFNQTIDRAILQNYDSMSACGYACNLEVRAYGAYTMRTEYEVLTGIEAKYLQTCAFHPYWSAKQATSWSIAHYLKQLGYATYCVHPFAKSFFYRDQALPKMGFDHFIALENFPIRDKFGPYISDAAVAKVVVNLLQQQAKPVFCFVITMENHGPWLFDRFSSTPVNFSFDFGQVDANVQRYLVHLANCDAMLKYLRSSLSDLQRATLLTLYGDHLPGLKTLIPSNFRDTPCLFWSSNPTVSAQIRTLYHAKKELKPAELGGLLLSGMNFCCHK